jgi:hypothetical protein
MVPATSVTLSPGCGLRTVNLWTCLILLASAPATLFADQPDAPGAGLQLRWNSQTRTFEVVDTELGPILTGGVAATTVAGRAVSSDEPLLAAKHTLAAGAGLRFAAKAELGVQIISVLAVSGAKAIKMLMCAHPPFDHLGYRDLGRVGWRSGARADERRC